MYDKLKKFHEENGHCQVLKRSLPDQKLYDWIQKQREQYSMYQDEGERKKRKCRLTEDKIKKLSDLGFDWSESNEMLEPEPEPEPVHPTVVNVIVNPDANPDTNVGVGTMVTNNIDGGPVGAEGIDYMYQYDPFSV